MDTIENNIDNGASIIQGILLDKKSKNSRYSLKALSRDLKISQPQLSKIIRGNRRLSPQLAYKIGLYLKLDKEKLLELLIPTLSE
jgi:plasmid maintenance system antidote protein VapI